MYTFVAMMGAATLSSLAFADLPTGTRTQTAPFVQQPYQQPYQQSYQPYMQGAGNGASYYNPSYYQQNQSLQYQQYLANAQRNQQLQNTTSTGGDLLWLFTGSQGTLSEQMKSGFKSSGQTSFFGRLFSVISSAAYRRVAPRINSILGGIDTRASMISQNASGLYNMYNQQGATGTCYNCALQNSTNPYYRNQNAIPTQIMSPTTGAPTGSGGLSK